MTLVQTAALAPNQGASRRTAESSTAITPAPATAAAASVAAHGGAGASGALTAACQGRS